MAKKSEIIKSQNKELDEYLKKFKSENQNLIFDGIGMGIMPGFVSKTSKGAKIAMNSKKGKAMYNELASKLKSFTGKTKTNISKTKPTVKEVIETKPNIPTNIPTTMELAQVPGSSVKTVQREFIKSFKGTKGKFTPKDTERVVKAREILNQPIAGTMRPSTISQGYRNPLANTSLRPYVNTKGNPFDFNKFKVDGDVVNKPLSNLIEGSIIVGGLGAGLMSSDSRLNSPKVNNKQTTSPVDLKRIDKSKLKPSKIEGVYITSALVDGKMKDFGIKWNNTTKSWEYYRGGSSAPIDNNNQNKGNNQGSNKSETTTPRSATGQSFDKAFAEARKQASGAGGIFEWNGKKYGTALKGETVPKNRVEVGKKEEYPTFESDPSLATLRQQDDDRQLLARAEAQKKEMMEFEPTEVLPTKPLSSLVFKTTNRRDEQAALYNIEADNKLPLKKKKYGGNLAMLKYMK